MTVAPGFWASVDREPLRISFPDVDGVRTRVIEAGDPSRRPLLLTHGIGGHAEAFIHNLAALGRHARVVAYDLPGHGWSSAPARSYEIDGYCRHLDAMLDLIGAERASVCGQSLGGWVALRYAARAPRRIERLVLVGAGGTRSDPSVMARIRQQSLDAVTHLSPSSVRRRLELIIADSALITDDLVDCRVRIYAQPDALERMERILCLQNLEIRQRNILTEEELGSVEAPTLVISGDCDTVVPLAVARDDIARHVPDSQLSVMNGCGHWPQFEDPDEFNRRTITFLTESDGTGRTLHRSDHSQAGGST